MTGSPHVPPPDVGGYVLLHRSGLGRSLLAGDASAPVPPVQVTVGQVAGNIVGPGAIAPAPTDAAPGKPACCAAEKPAELAGKKPCCEEIAAAPPVTARSLYQLDATWIDDRSEPVQLASLRGRPVVLAMFFASCEYACPVLTSDMQRLRALLPAEVRESARFVLVSFDTARDVPAALNAYRKRSDLDDSWALLRGENAAVQDLAMLLGVKFKQDAQGQFAHSNLITILNLEGEITHQRPGLQGDVSEAAKAVVLAAKKPGGA